MFTCVENDFKVSELETFVNHHEGETQHVEADEDTDIMKMHE